MFHFTSKKKSDFYSCFGLDHDPVNCVSNKVMSHIHMDSVASLLGTPS